MKSEISLFRDLYVSDNMLLPAYNKLLLISVFKLNVQLYLELYTKFLHKNFTLINFICFLYILFCFLFFYIFFPLYKLLGSGSSMVTKCVCSAGDKGLISGNPFEYSCLENPVDRGAWRDRVHRVAVIKSQT